MEVKHGAAPWNSLLEQEQGSCEMIKADLMYVVTYQHWVGGFTA